MVNKLCYFFTHRFFSSRSYFGNANTFGGPSEVSLKTSTRMMKIEESNEEAMIVFVADVWLDNTKVSV